MTLHEFIGKAFFDSPCRNRPVFLGPRHDSAGPAPDSPALAHLPARLRLAHSIVLGRFRNSAPHLPCRAGFAKPARLSHVRSQGSGRSFPFTVLPVSRFEYGRRGRCAGCARPLYQRSLILTRFTPWRFGLIFAASQERVAPPCGTRQATRDAGGGRDLRPGLGRALAHGSLRGLSSGLRGPGLTPTWRDAGRMRDTCDGLGPATRVERTRKDRPKP